MKLLKLNLTNFRGIRDLVFEPNGQDYQVFAANGVGKTTIWDAHLWVLLGKDSMNRSDYEIKTTKPDGEAIPNLDHSVEALYELNRGEKITLKRVYKEKYSGDRGSEKVLKGHETAFFVNGVPVLKNQYEDRIHQKSDLPTLQILSDLHHAPFRLDAAKLRDLLVRTFGNISDDEVISANEDLADLTEMLDGRAPDDLRSISKHAKTALVKRQGELPAVIAEANRAIVEVNDLPLCDVKLVESQILQYRNMRNEVSMGGGATLIQNEIRLLDGKILDFENAFNRESISATSEESKKAQSALLQKTKEKSDKELRLQNLYSGIQRAEASIADEVAKMDDLRQKELRLLKVCSPGPDRKTVKLVRKHCQVTKLKSFDLRRRQRLTLINQPDLKKYKPKEWRPKS